MRKVGRQCERCGQPGPARYRTLADRFLCALCYDEWLDARGTLAGRIVSSPARSVDSELMKGLPVRRD